MDSSVRIVSYRRVFKSDERITGLFDVDFTKWWPGGIPAMPVGYALVALAAMWLLSHTPGLGEVASLAPSWLRYLTVPAAVAILASRDTPDGRANPFAYVWAQLRVALGLPAVWTAGGVPVPPLDDWTVLREPVAMHWDASSPTPRPCRIVGPARITSRESMRLKASPSRLQASRGGERPLAVVLNAGTEMSVS